MRQLFSSIGLCHLQGKGDILRKSHIGLSSLPGAAYQTPAPRAAPGNNQHLADLKKQIPEVKGVEVIVGPSTEEEQAEQSGAPGTCMGVACAQRGLAEGGCRRTVR